MCRLPRDAAEKGAGAGGQKPEGAISLDFRGKAPGRGAYLCPNSECLKKAIRAKALERAFSTQIPPEVLDALVQTMEEQANE